MRTRRVEGSWKLAWALLGTIALYAAPLRAEEPAVTPLDLGILKDREVGVVQKMLYPMKNRSELGLHVGVMPFDAFTVAPMANITYGHHSSETFGWEVAVGGGYGFKTSTYKTMESPAYGVAAEAYRFLGRAIVGVEWTPIYAKLNWKGTTVIHDNVYGLLGAGASMEQSILPSGEIAVAPTISPGVGVRLFSGKATAFRFELRDDVLFEQHALAGGFGLKQNMAVTVGVTHLSKAR
jgi:outer membrane beta-barrel protein